MNKLLKHLTVICLLSIKIQAQQNLVPNPSFEIYDTCPYQQAQVNYALPWFDPTKTSSDYNNACCTNGIAGMPNNFYGYKQAQDGNAIIGLVTFNPPFPNSYREYIAVKLNSQLDSNKTYCFSTYISPSGFGKYTSNGFGILLVKDSTNISNYYYTTISIIPNAIDTNIISDTSSWKKIEFTFTNSNANYLIMGCFLKDNVIKTQINNQNSYIIEGAYYYIDNVSLIDCTPAFFEIPNIVTDNNDGINDIFFIKGLQENTEINIYNRWGTKIYYTDNYKNDWKPDESSDTYYYLIKTTNKTYKGFLEIIK